jgi:hypothetical protein
MKWILIVALALMATSTAHAAGKRTDPQSGVRFPKGYLYEKDPNAMGWFCEVTDHGVRFYKAKGGGGKRKRDAVCE